MSKKSNVYTKEKLAEHIISVKEGYERSVGRKVSATAFFNTLKGDDVSEPEFYKAISGTSYPTAKLLLSVSRTHRVSAHKLIFGHDWKLIHKLISHPNYNPNSDFQYFLDISDRCTDTLDSAQERDNFSHPDGFTESVAFRFEQIRKFCGLNLNEAAKQLGCSYTTVQRNEQNYDDLPSVNYLTVFCENMSVAGDYAPADYLLFGEFPSLPNPIRGILVNYTFAAQVTILAKAIAYLDTLA